MTMRRIAQIATAAATIWLSPCGVDCPEDTRECITERGDHHCVLALEECGAAGITVCRAIECSPDAHDECTDFHDEKHCGDCWHQCEPGTYCSREQRCEPLSP